MIELVEAVQDFKTGWLTFSSPRAMFVAQMAGMAAGCFIGMCWQLPYLGITACCNRPGSSSLALTLLALILLRWTIHLLCLHQFAHATCRSGIVIALLHDSSTCSTWPALKLQLPPTSSVLHTHDLKAL